MRIGGAGKWGLFESAILNFFFQKQKKFLLHLNEKKQHVNMRYHLFLQYGWFLQNLRKYFIPTNMHTTVDINCAFKPEETTISTLYFSELITKIIVTCHSRSTFFLVACNEIIRLHFQLHISFFFLEKKGNAQSYYVFPTDFLLSSYKKFFMVYKTMKIWDKMFYFLLSFQTFFRWKPSDKQWQMYSVHGIL